MAYCTASWEDEENNRIVELSVEYQLADTCLQIERVTPTAVVFLYPQTGEAVRKIKVWTETGRRMLLNQYRQAVGSEHLQQQLDAHLAENVG